jgi:hypothetical protein
MSFLLSPSRRGDARRIGRTRTATDAWRLADLFRVSNVEARSWPARESVCAAHGVGVHRSHRACVSADHKIVSRISPPGTATEANPADLAAAACEAHAASQRGDQTSWGAASGRSGAR